MISHTDRVLTSQRAPIAQRRQWLGGAAAVAACAVAAPAIWAQGGVFSAPLPKLTMSVGGKANFNNLPLTIAEQLGFFKAEGLDVEIADLAGWSRAMQAVATGAADVCCGAFGHTIRLQSKGQAFRAFVLLGRAPQTAMGVSTRTMAGYKNWADLKGRKIGVSAPGSSANLLAHAVLSRAGILSTDVSYVGVGNSSGAIAALRNGQVDAMSNTEPVMTMLEQKGDVKIIADTRTLKSAAAVFGGMMPAACLYASSSFIDNHAASCQALTNAVVHSLKWLQTAGPRDLMRTVPEAYLLGDRALYLAAFTNVREAYALDGMLPPEAARTALRAMAQFEGDLKPERLELSKLYTNEFARKAKARFKV